MMDPPPPQFAFQQSPPALSNPPPSIFGVYTAPDGSPMTASFHTPDALFGTGEDHSENNDPKRRRIARACDMCRKKKIKCDGKAPKCTHCLNYKTECVFTHVEKKRQPPKGPKYIEGLENRLARMESLLRLSGTLSEDDPQIDLGTLEQRLADKSAIQGPSPSRNSQQSPSIQTRAGSQSYRNTPQQQVLSSPSSQTSAIASPLGVVEKAQDSPNLPASSSRAVDSRKASQDEVEELSDMMCSLVTNGGETRYIGSTTENPCLRHTDRT